ncbi:MAG: hypothetical protein EBR38_08450 [Flavobacteriaceae bacterium]|nr:hypothetical protein [Flavobacteriaceae bacterium]
MARTGIHGGQGPRQNRLIKGDNAPLDIKPDNVEQMVLLSLKTATWLDEADLASASIAVQLAKSMDEMPNRRHQLAPILIGLLSNLGLLNNRQEDTIMTPQEMLQAIAGGQTK